MRDAGVRGGGPKNLIGRSLHEAPSRSATAGAAGLLVLLVLLIGAGCSTGPDGEAGGTDRSDIITASTTTTTTTTTSSTTSVAPTSTPSATAAPVPPPPTSTSPTTAPPVTAPPITAIPTDQSGQIFAIVESFDPAARTVVVDVAQYLGGDDYYRYLAADPSTWGELYCPDAGGDYDGTQDLADCYSHGQAQTVVNENSRLRTLSVAPDATFAVSLDGNGATQPASESQFAHFVERGVMGNTFWLDVTDGWVRSLEFQFFS